MNVGLSVYATALQFLSECLEQYYGQKVIILLDEYDVPLETLTLMVFMMKWFLLYVHYLSQH